MNGKIYKITNNINGKVYIGLTTQKVEVRWKQHCKVGYMLTDAIKKYGQKEFSIETLISDIENIEELNRLEKEFVVKYRSHVSENGYNLTRGGESNSYIFNQTGKKFSEESRKKMSKNHADVSGILNPRFKFRYILTKDNRLLKSHIDKIEIEKLKLSNKFWNMSKFKNFSKNHGIVFLEKPSFEYDRTIYRELLALRTSWWEDETSPQYRYIFRENKNRIYKIEVVVFTSPTGKRYVTTTKPEFRLFCKSKGFKTQTIVKFRDNVEDVYNLSKRSKFYGWKIIKIKNWLKYQKGKL